MAATQSLPVVRLRLACADEAEFQRKYAAYISKNGVFVPATAPPAVGASVAIEIALTDGSVGVRGEAVVVRHGKVRDTAGMTLRLNRLAPDSFQFPLESVLPPAAGPATPAAATTPGLDLDIQLATSQPADAASRAAPPVATEAPGPPAGYDPLSAPTGVTGADPAAGEGDALEPFDELGNYSVLKRLGSGGMAEVYLARAALDEGVDRLVALKTVRPAFGPASRFASLFLAEARLSATLQHPNLVQVFDCGEASGRSYLAMEYVHGRDLLAVLRRLSADPRPPPVHFAVAVAMAMCEALEYVHEKRDLDGGPLKLVHRDVSPSNVVVTPRGEVKLLDFGIAAAAVSETGSIPAGKGAYAPPEQAQGGTPEPTWDVYAVGVVLRDLLTLERLRARDGALRAPNAFDPRGVAPSRPSRTPPSALNPEVPPSLDAAVLGATDPEPRRRPASARALREALERVQREAGACDVGVTIRELFGAALSAEETEIERLMLQARARAGRGLAAAVRRAARPLRSVRRRIAGTRSYQRLARYPWAAPLVALALVAAAGGVGTAAYRAWDTEARYVARLAQADERIAGGRLVGPGGDEALDHLGAARAIKVDHRVLGRLERLSDLFVSLGEAALSRHNPAEAAVHFEAALAAVPGRADAAARLREIEQSVRQQTRDRLQPARPGPGGDGRPD